MSASSFCLSGGNMPTESNQAPDVGVRKGAGNLGSIAPSTVIAIVISFLVIVGWLLAWDFQMGGRWIHLLPVVALIIVIVLLIAFSPAKDIETEDDVMPKWNAENVA